MKIKTLKIIPAVFLFLSVASAAHASKDVEEEYTKAKACYGELKIEPAKAKSRGAWERCISLFSSVHAKHKDSARGPAAIYNVGKLRQELYAKQRRLDDAEAAVKAYNVLISEYPKNSLADDALYQIGNLRHDPMRQDDKAEYAFAYIIENYPNGDMAVKAKEALENLKQSPEAATTVKDAGKNGGDDDEPGDVVVAAPSADAAASAVTPAAAKKRKSQDLTPFVTPFDTVIAGPRNLAALVSVDVEKGEGETSVVLGLSRKAAYSAEFTGVGLRTKSPPKLDLLIMYTKPSESVAKELKVSSANLTGIKVKKDFLKGGTRVVFEMTPNSTYDIDAKAEKIILRFRKVGEKPRTESKGKSAAKEAADKRPIVIVIDPGHGGDDTGAIGPTGLEEKNVTLSVSKFLASQLKEIPGTKVYLTRDGDETLTLEDRNKTAVSKKADIFVSIHANAAKNRRMSGIETYFLNNATDAAAEKLAKRENMASKKKLSDVEHILSTMLQNYDAEESKILAGDVQRTLMAKIGKRYKGVKNRDVRSALFYVLVGAKCPAILVETSFISNPAEEKRLKGKAYKADLASAIAAGVQKYIKGTGESYVRK